MRSAIEFGVRSSECGVRYHPRPRITRIFTDRELNPCPSVPSVVASDLVRSAECGVRSAAFRFQICFEFRISSFGFRQRLWRNRHASAIRPGGGLWTRRLTGLMLQCRLFRRSPRIGSRRGRGRAGLTGSPPPGCSNKRAPRSALFDRERSASADTGHTTAHLTYVTDERLHQVVKKFGRDCGKAFWEAGAVAIDQIYSLVESNQIDCDFQWVQATSTRP